MPAAEWLRVPVALCLSCVTASHALADTAAPSVEPLPAYSAGASVLVRGRAQPLAYVFVRNEHRRVQARADAVGAFSVAVPLEPNERNRLSVYASPDAEGHRHKSEQVHVTTISDAIAPAITASLIPPPNAGGWHRAPATVRFTCSDAGSGLASCPADVVVSTPGANQIVSGEAVDRAGNRMRASVPVNLDTSVPQVRLDGSPIGVLVHGDSLAISGSVRDDVSGVSALNCNAVPAQLSGERFSCTVPLREGDNAIRVWALDAAGNIGGARTSVVFGPRLPRGNAHESVIAADVNGDGIVDVVRTHFVNGTVGIALGRADGTFAPEQWVSVGPYPTAVMQALGQPCFRTDDDELNQRVFTQGIQLTGDLPTFLDLDPMPATAGIPFLLINTNRNWGVFQSITNTQRATFATSTSTVASRSMTADSWGAYAYAGLAAVAAGALAQGLKDQLSRFDWYAGPTSALPSGPSVLDQNDELQKGLAGTGATSAAVLYGSYLDWAAQHWDMLNTRFPAAPPPGGDPCADGPLSAARLGLDDKLSQFQAAFKGPKSGDIRAHVFVQYIESRGFGFNATCRTLRALAECSRRRGASLLEISAFAINPKVGKFLSENFFHEELEGLTVWGIPVLDTAENRSLKAARCLF